MMHIAYVVYSRGGMSLKLARQLQSSMGGDLIMLREKKPIAESLLYVQGSFLAMMDRERAVENIGSLAAYDVLVFVMPVWAGAIPPAMRAFLHSRIIGDKYVLGVLTHQGAPGEAPEKLRRLMLEAGIPFPTVVDVDSRGDFEDLSSGNLYYALMEALQRD